MIGGVFFAFSSFVMKALARAPASQGIATMQSINITVINRSFLGAFMGTAALSLAIVAIALIASDRSSAVLFLAGAITYFIGTFLITIFANVPLNNKLARLAENDASAQTVWTAYLHEWTLRNHARTAAATLAALLNIFGLIQHAGT